MSKSKPIFSFTGLFLFLVVLAACYPPPALSPESTLYRPPSSMSSATQPSRMENTALTDAILPAPVKTTIAATATLREDNPAGKFATAASTAAVYYAQSGDSLQTVAKRFNLNPKDITSPDPLPTQGLLLPDQLLYLPNSISPYEASEWLLPDSEIVHGPSAVEFNVAAYLATTNGFLKQHREYLKSTAWTSAADIITRLALENSINPRIFLSLLEYKCHCVLGQLDPEIPIDFLLGNMDFRTKGLYRQLAWAASQLSVGYYGWRAGSLPQIQIAEDVVVPLTADLNPGSVAMLKFLAFYKNIQTPVSLLDHGIALAKVHSQMFGDPWKRVDTYGVLFPAHTEQPELSLPFEQVRVWSYSSGPHTVWEKEGAQAAIDFAPATYYPGCVPSDAWVVAMASGVVVREEYAAVILDLDQPDGTPADGLEQTGWVILYMHIGSQDRVTAGTRLNAGDRIGHPSCEGGRATGTHVHIARKYNGEWVLADGTIPFIMDGWMVHAGDKPYQGTLTNGSQIVVAHPYGSYETRIARPTPIPTVISGDSNP